MTKDNAVRKLKNLSPGDILFYVDFAVTKENGKVHVTEVGTYSLILDCVDIVSSSVDQRREFIVLDESGELFTDVIYANQIKNNIVKILPKEPK